jgi:hypothetical protein
MIRLSPQVQYNASIKSLKSKEKTQEVKWPGFRLEHYMKHPDFLVTITSTADTSKYAPVDRKAGTKAAQAKAELMISASN